MKVGAWGQHREHLTDERRERIDDCGPVRRHRTRVVDDQQQVDRVAAAVLIRPAIGAGQILSRADIENSTAFVVVVGVIGGAVRVRRRGRGVAGA